MSVERRVGTAGWTLPGSVREFFGTGGTHLERYSRHFSCVEINSTFYRPHRVSTYERWARSVPGDFRFALKMPKEITHTKRFAGTDSDLERFIDASAALGDKRDVILVQLPPSFAYDAALTGAFFERLRRRYPGRIACEPRHASWFTEPADALLTAFDVARVAADPPPAGVPFAPGGTNGFQYWRLHGSPRMYYSSYDAAWIEDFVTSVRTVNVPVWCIFDNTTLGAATANALAVKETLGRAGEHAPIVFG